MTAVPAVPTPRGQVRERPGRELVPAQFGLLDPLTDIAHGYYLDGFSDDAVTACRMWAVLADAVDDVVTSRYLLYIQAVALLELGRYGDAVDVAAQLIDSLDGADEPVWRAKALAATAEASTRLARPSAAIAALAEADWLVRSVPSGTYGHLSASMALALALRSANLVERSDEVLSRLDGLGDALVEVLIIQELALLSAHWATVLSLIGRREEARRHYADTARRALRMQACARLADSPSMVARGEVIEAFAMLHLGDTELAAARARGAAGRFDARPELMESHLLLLVLGTSAARGGDLLGARLHLRALVRDAEGCGREVWAMAGRAALADVDTLQHGEAEGTVLWREVAQTALASVWAEREARFAALRDQDSIRDLTERADRYGRDILEDPLTGLGNRRMLTRALKGQVGDSVIFVDVDEFQA
ncbi:MAG: hypothetical protein HGA44_21980, partial [Cellulomonadaceae bacterium]|nr:hypothetical protein [Cellulomonadaceae bacterium]